MSVENQTLKSFPCSLSDPLSPCGPRSDSKSDNSETNISIDNELDPSHISMRTFVQFDSPLQSEDEEDFIDEDDRSVSPLSVHTPPSSGTRWIRFFPELSSHFSLTSPVLNNQKQFTPLHPLDDEVPDLDQTRRHSSEPVELKPASSSSFEAIDDASSCYSDKTSLTSTGSEYVGEHQVGKCGSPYKSPDAFSIMSPVTAGVFDDSESIQQSLSPLRPRCSVTETKNKPLPETPAILPPPLSIRRNVSPTSDISDDIFSGSSAHSIPTRQTGSSLGGVTLSEVAEQVEDTLAGFGINDWSSSKAMQILNGPLQISRGNMDMIATRPAPQPPVHKQQRNSKSVARVLSRQRVNKSVTFDETKQTKKHAKHKAPFSFSVPGFGRKQGNPRRHLRSFSSSNMKSEMESNGMQDLEDSNDIVSRNPIQGRPARPSSISSERELRQKLPRLETKKTQPVSQFSYSTSSGSTERIIAEGKNSVSSPVKSKIDAFKDRIFISSNKPRRTNTFVLPCQLGSLKAPEVIYELEALPALRTVKMGKFPSKVPKSMILSILSHSNSLDDLFNFAVINKSFYRVFKENELQLIKNSLYDMSPPAWELREMSPPWNAEWQILLDPDAQVPEYTPTLYLRRYAQDIFTLAQLKSLILARCSTFLRHDTIRGLAGLDSTRAAEIDEAFWRIWTFCRIFGCGKNREDKVEGQIDWLNGGAMAMQGQTPETTAVAAPFSLTNVLFQPPVGFGRGNTGGLSQGQLYDMTEIWTCLSVLLQPLHGKCKEAREVGIFDGFDIKEGDTPKEEAILEEWTAYVLSLGLSAVLCLGSICPSDTSASTFRKAQAIGLTKWELCESEFSRSSFLKEAVSKVYKLREEEASSLHLKRLSNSSMHMQDRPSSQRNGAQSFNGQFTDQHRRQRQAAFAAELRAKQKTHIDSSFENERPLSNYTFIMNHLEGRNSERRATSPVPPVPVPPIRASSIQASPIQPPPIQIPPTQVSQIQTPPTQPPPIPPRSIARINSTNRSGVQQIPHPAAPPRPQVLDPVDRAIRMMVQELGFDEGDAKWALKITDTGEGIDADAAVALLYRERLSIGRSQGSNSGSLISSVMNSGEMKNSGWRWN